MSKAALRVGIFGTFDVENYGDLLFPLLAEMELKQRLGNVEIVPFSYHAKSPPEWPYAVTSLTELPDLIEGLDAALIGGGHLIRFDTSIAPGYGPPSPNLHHPTAYWLVPALMAGQAGIPVAWNAPGALGDVPDWARPLLELALGCSEYVALRDMDSCRAMSPFAAVPPTRVPDTAFGIARLLAASGGVDSHRKGTSAYRDRYIVVQATWGLAPFLDMVRRMPDELRDCRFVVVPIGPINLDHVELLGEPLPGADYPAASNDPLSLAALIAGSVGVVGTSLHLSITALASGVPVFRPATHLGDKYAPLADFDAVHSFEADVDPQWFAARLGRRPSPLARAAEAELAVHWDRIASVVSADKRTAVPRAYFDFWQALPSRLESRATPTKG